MSYIGNPIISTDFPKDTFSGNGSTTAFTMAIAPASVNSVIVVVSGITQDPSTYTISGTTLTFSAAPPTGTSNISVRHLGVAGTPQVPATGSVTSASIAAQDLAINGVTVGKGGGSVASNTVTGYQAGYSNTTGAYNAFFGVTAAYTNTTGSYNTAVGQNALYYNSTGQYNTALGSQALGYNTASSNTAVGYQAGYSLTTGGNNVLMGYYGGIGGAGSGLTTATANTFIGPSSGYLVTTGSKNTFLGAFSGNSGTLDLRTASNYIVLSDGDGNPRQWCDNNGSWKNTNQAWVNFNGTGTVAIRASWNVSSITDNGTGDYTVNFTTAMSDANYTMVGSIGQNVPDTAANSVFLGPNAVTTTTARINSTYSTATTNGLTDRPGINVAFFR